MSALLSDCAVWLALTACVIGLFALADTSWAKRRRKP